MTKWDSRVEKTTMSRSQAILTTLGRDGWELVSVVGPSAGPDVFLFLKRAL
jgi:hypothetical protein